jgi:aromatic ring-opening dioxygenase catalytic subunit (LigB family)
MAMFLLSAMQPWAWALMVFCVGTLAVVSNRWRPAPLWKITEIPLTEIHASFGFNDPDAMVEITYQRNGQIETARMMVAEFRKLVVKDEKSQKSFIRERSLEWLTHIIFCCIGIFTPILLNHFFQLR